MFSSVSMTNDTWPATTQLHHERPRGSTNPPMAHHHTDTHTHEQSQPPTNENERPQTQMNRNEHTRRWPHTRRMPANVSQHARKAKNVKIYHCPVSFVSSPLPQLDYSPLPVFVYCSGWTRGRAKISGMATTPRPMLNACLIALSLSWCFAVIAKSVGLASSSQISAEQVEKVGYAAYGC